MVPTVHGKIGTTEGGQRRELPARLSVTGKYYQLKDAPFEPKTVQKPHPPILVGGQGPKLILPVIARHANIWHMRVRDVTPESIKGLSTNFDAVCRKVGPDPAEVERAVSLRPEQLAGATEEVRRNIQALADVGIRHFVISLSPTDRKLLGRFAKELMPAFRGT